MKLSHLMMSAAMIGCGAVFAKTEVTPPTLATSPYTGAVQEATVPESADWNVVFKERGEHVGVYDIFLRLADPDNFAWAGSDEAMITVPFEIVRAVNEWTVTPSITGWTFGETAHEPTAAAKFGGVRPVVYSGTTASGATIANAAAVSEAGSYTATFDVAESADYTALHQAVNFTVAKKSAAGEDFVVTVGANPKYDGTQKTIPVTSVTFAGEDIPYSVAGNKQTNAGTYQLTVTATGNYSGSKTVEWKILPRSVTLTSGSASRAYTGQPLAKKEVSVTGDGFVRTEGATYAVTGSRTDVGTSANAFSYTLKSGTLAGNYQIATVTGKLTVSKAGNSWTTVPNVMGKTYDGKPVSVVNGVATFGSVNTAFTSGGASAPKNAGSYSATFTVADCANYAGLSKSVSFTIVQRDISLVTVAAIPDQTETGSAICPAVKVTDGNPSIVTAEDFTVSYANNTAPGMATVTLTGKRNYKGTKSVTFKIIAKPVEEKAALTAEAGWKLLKATGTYFAQVKVKCTDGYAAGISNLKFAFADRKDGAGKALAQLWNTQGRSAVSATVSYQGTKYRVIPLSAASITGVNVPATYGVTSLSASTIPVGERVIEMYVPKRDLPSHLGEYTACILWDSQGKTYLAPVNNTSAQ